MVVGRELASVLLMYSDMLFPLYCFQIELYSFRVSDPLPGNYENALSSVRSVQQPIPLPGLQSEEEVR